MRLSEFRGSAAGSSLKAAKYPEYLPRALNPGGFLVSPEPCSFSSHSSDDWRMQSPFTVPTAALWCSVCLGAAFPWKIFVCVSTDRYSWSCRNWTLPTLCDTEKMPCQGRCREYFGFDKISHLVKHPRIHPGLRHHHVSITGCVTTQLHPAFPNSCVPKLLPLLSPISLLGWCSSRVLGHPPCLCSFPLFFKSCLPWQTRIFLHNWLN